MATPLKFSGQRYKEAMLYFLKAAPAVRIHA